MKRELEDELVKLAPTFLKDMHADETVTCMAWGVSCSDGWYSVVKEICEKLEAINMKMDGKAKVIADQIKEKFGELTVYYHVEGDMPSELKEEASAIVCEAEEKSWSVCEECGKPATMTTKGWITRLCEECYERRTRK